MKAKIVTIGNSKGIRIPKVFLEECEITDQVELEVEKKKMILKPIKRKPREGWDKAFKFMHDNHEDILLIDESIDKDLKDWEWK